MKSSTASPPFFSKKRTTWTFSAWPQPAPTNSCLSASPPDFPRKWFVLSSSVVLSAATEGSGLAGRDLNRSSPWSVHSAISPQAWLQFSPSLTHSPSKSHQTFPNFFRLYLQQPGGFL